MFEKKFQSKIIWTFFWIHFDVFDNDDKIEIFDFINKKFAFIDV